MSLEPVSKDQNSQMPVKHLKTSRSSIYQAANIAYESSYAQFDARAKELDVFQEQLARRVEAVAKDRFSSRETLLKENESYVSRRTYFKDTLDKIEQLSGLLEQLEKAFDGLMPAAPADTSSDRNDKIERGKINIGVRTALVKGLYAQMSRKFNQIELLMQNFNKLAMRDDGGGLSSPSTSIVERNSFAFGSSKMFPGPSLYDQLPPEFFSSSSSSSTYDQLPPAFSSSSSSSSTSDSLTSPPTSFPMGKKVLGDLIRKNREYDAEQAALVSPDELDDSGRSMNTTIIENPVEEGSFVEGSIDIQRQTKEIIISIGGHIDYLMEADEEIQKMRSELEQATRPIPLTKSERVNSKTRTPPKSAASSVASSGRSTPKLPSYQAPRRVRMRPVIPQKTERSCSGPFDWLRSCMGYREKEHLTIKVERRSSITTDDSESQNLDNHDITYPQNNSKNFDLN